MEIPDDYAGEVLRELDQLNWDVSEYPVLWVLLNKLKEVCEWSEDCREEVNWSDLDR